MTANLCLTVRKDGFLASNRAATKLLLLIGMNLKTKRMHLPKNKSKHWWDIHASMQAVGPVEQGEARAGNTNDCPPHSKESNFLASNRGITAIMPAV